VKLNLGCGGDIKEGYVNVDQRELAGVDVTCDLLKMPWPWADESVDEVLMLDFFEHVPYVKNGAVLDEVWRILKPGGTVTIQVPDFDHSAAVIQARFPFVCNKCEREINEFGGNDTGGPMCPLCGHDWHEMVQVAMQRLYGGQDYPGNWHFFSFNRGTLKRKLFKHGFNDHEILERDHQYRQWSLKIQSKRRSDVW